MSGKIKAAGLAPKAAHNKTRANIISFPTVAATCVSCGTAFRRAYGETWKARCLECWKHCKLHRAVVAFARWPS